MTTEFSKDHDPADAGVEEEGRSPAGFARVSPREVAIDLATGMYRAVIDESFYARLLDLWEEHVFATHEIPADLAELMERQADQMEPLLAEFIRGMQTSDELIASILRESSPCALVSRTGLVIAINGPGRSFLLVDAGEMIDPERIEPSDRRQFSHFLRDLEHARADDAPVLLRLDCDGESRLVALTPCRLAGSPLVYARISGLDLAIPARAYEIMASAFGLTEGEAELMQALMDGKGGAEFARERGIREDTIKKRIKTIREKTGTAGQAELLRMVASIARFAVSADTRGERPSVTNFAGRTYVLPAAHKVLSVGGRQIEYLLAGPRTGFPVLMHHGLVTGILPTEEMVSSFARRGLRLIIPLRPGFGVSAKLDGPNRPETVAPHLAGFVNALGIERFAMLSITSGTLFALAMHELLPGRITGHVAAGGFFPVTRNEIHEHMRPFIRSLFVSTRDYPGAARFLVTCGYRVTLQSGPGAFFNAIFRKAGKERDLLSEPQINESLAAGTPIAAAQGIDSYMEETGLVAEDLMAWSRTLVQPLTVVHGTDDAVFPLPLARLYCERAPASQLIAVSDHTQVIAYSHRDVVADELLATIQGGERRSA